VADTVTLEHANVHAATGQLERAGDPDDTAADDRVNGSAREKMNTRVENLCWRRFLGRPAWPRLLLRKRPWKNTLRFLTK
jgi:hypothetical protein